MAPRLALALAVFLALPLRGLSAQLRGTVQDSHGVPVYSATVEVWQRDSSRGSAHTSVDGRFVIPRAIPGVAATVLVRRLGFLPARHSVASVGADTIHVVLSALPASLPEYVVSASAPGCSRPDDPAARAAYVKLARSYFTFGSDGRFVGPWMHGHRSTGDLPAADVGFVDDSRMAETWWGWAFPKAIDAQGRYPYAKRLPSDRLDYRPLSESEWHWRYADLGQSDFPHFLTSTFSDAQQFSRDRERTGESVIRFCGRERGAPYLEGTIHTDGDSVMTGIEYLFHTPKPREDAGGQLTLATSTWPGRRMLVPVRTVFWRKLGGRDWYYQEAFVLTGWRLDGMGQYVDPGR
ncbi:MAG: hypothetical protein JWO05_1044 [Gemmatimonadetes bacterium]|nr:hypothetical protein [Gemmatimonadota bacterium]